MMITQRKFYTVFVILITLATVHAHGMDVKPIYVIAPQSSISRDMLMISAGLVIGAGCVGAYCWYINHESRLSDLEVKIDKLEKDQKSMRESVRIQKQRQKEEEKRHNQTRVWIIDEKEKRDEQVIHLTKQSMQMRKLKKRIDALEEKEQFYSFSSTSDSNAE
jgi:hypothetical protein